MVVNLGIGGAVFGTCILSNFLTNLNNFLFYLGDYTNFIRRTGNLRVSTVSSTIVNNALLSNNINAPVNALFNILVGNAVSDLVAARNALSD